MSSLKKEPENLEPSQYKKREERPNYQSKESPQVQLDKLTKLFWANNPYVRDVQKNNESSL